VNNGVIDRIRLEKAITRVLMAAVVNRNPVALLLSPSKIPFPNRKKGVKVIAPLKGGEKGKPKIELQRPKPPSTGTR
jgi:hypothetical protein